MTHRILVAAATTRWSLEAVHRAAAAAGADGEIVLAYVLETPALRRAYRRTNRSGYLGKAQLRSLVDRLREEHRRLAEQRIADALAAAAERGIAVEVRQLEGRYSDRVLEQEATGTFARVFLTRADRPGLSRLLFGSEVRRVARRLQDRVELVD